MAFSSYTVTNWLANPITINFDVLRAKYLSVVVNSNPTTDFTINGREITINSPSPAGQTVVITRTTDLADDDFLVQFTDASSLRAEDLETATKQLLHCIQEISEGNITATGGLYLPADVSRTFWDASAGTGVALQIRNVSTPSNAPVDAAATKGYVDTEVAQAAAGNLPGTSGNKGRHLTVDDSETSSSWKYRPAMTSTFLLTDTGPTTLLSSPAVISTSEGDYADQEGGRFINPGSGAKHGSSASSIYADSILGWTKIDQTREFALEGASFGADVASGTNGKVIQVQALQGGWQFELNVLAYARKRDGNANWSTGACGFHVLFLDEDGAGNTRFLSRANDYIDGQGLTGVAQRHFTEPDLSQNYQNPGVLCFPNSMTTSTLPGQYLEVGNFFYSGTTPLRRDKEICSYTFKGQLPVTKPVMNLRVSVACTSGVSNDYIIFARPTTLTLSTNPGQKPVG